MIKLKLASKNFHEKPILANIDLQIDSNDRFALLGPSGIGKTTLLRILAGLDHDFEGSYQRPKSVALMFQEPNLLPWRSVFNNLKIFHPEVDDVTIHTRLEKIGLGEKAHDFPNQLSLGQQRRLALARAFLSPVDFVLLDEPFASLDEETTAQMRSLTLALLADQKTALVIVTHNSNDASKLGAKPIYLSGNPATIA